MNKNAKILAVESKIQIRKSLSEAESIITEMKKVGIEDLPYSYSALNQFIDPQTMKIHYTKHYLGYVEKLNKALSKRKGGDVDLENIIKNISQYSRDIRNNAGGAFNHALFWKMLSPKPKKLTGELLEKITKSFGTFAKFKKEFEEEANKRFGSGWVWLIITGRNTLKIISTPNQDNPLMNVIEGGGFPILGLDLWEHAYYLKYQNKKDEYISNFWKVVNWDFVSKLYEMKIKTRLVESTDLGKVISEGKSYTCKPSDVDFYRTMFNKNPEVKKIYMRAINEILKEVFHEKYSSEYKDNQMPGIYNLEKEGRSVINKLNTNYNGFCILVNDVNKVIHKQNIEPEISFEGKSDEQQIEEVKKFVRKINSFKNRIFSVDSSTFKNLMMVLTEKDTQGKMREQITAAILKRHFKNRVTVEVIGDEMGDKRDMLHGIDMIVNLDGNIYPAQVKPYRERKLIEGEIILYGTGQVKPYKTDWMIFQKGKNVMVFNKTPKIIEGNYVFPADSLIYDIN